MAESDKLMIVFYLCCGTDLGGEVGAVISEACAAG
jgi:hypothetical protein